MSKPNVDTFLELAQRSNLVDKDQLEAELGKLRAACDHWPVDNPDIVADHLVHAGLITRWQAERLLEGRHRGFFLKHYKLLDHLGTGGMSSVYLAEHVLMQRRVAIKVLPKAPRQRQPRTWPASIARPRPPPPWTTATSSGPTTSTTKATSTTW